MQEVYKFIASHYQILGSAIVFVISLVFLIVKKKPVHSVYESILLSCISAVLYVERLPDLKGSDKLNAAIVYVYDELKRTYPELDITKYKNTIVSCIELILETPQKKGD